MKKNFVVDNMFSVIDETQEKDNIPSVSNTSSVSNKYTKEEIEELAKIISESKEIANKIGRPKKTEAEKVGGYKFNLNLNKEDKYFVQNIAWLRRKSITEYMRDLIDKDREEYFRNGGTTEDWEEV